MRRRETSGIELLPTRTDASKTLLRPSQRRLRSDLCGEVDPEEPDSLQARPSLETGGYWRTARSAGGVGGVGAN